MLDGDVGGDDSCDTVHTSNIFVPHHLLQWARQQNLAPRRTYSSSEEFAAVVVESLHNVQTKIQNTGSHHLFWDYPRVRLGRTAPVPKLEPQSMSGIRALLHDQSILLGFDVSAEAKAGHGDLDIKLVAPLDKGGMSIIAIEGKNAHSDDLVHGLEHQLPSYMRSIRADYGVYVVLWYKSGTFDQPSGNVIEVMWHLTKLRPIKNIIIESIDLSMPLRPSDKKFKYE